MLDEASPPDCKLSGCLSCSDPSLSRYLLSSRGHSGSASKERRLITEQLIISIFLLFLQYMSGDMYVVWFEVDLWYLQKPLACI